MDNLKLNSNFSLRVSCNIHQIKWENSPSKGVKRRRLERDESRPPIERVTTIVKFAPNSSFSGHVHHGGEEFLVLDGVFSDQHADYHEGYYVRNPKGTGHAPHSVEGCTILVKLWQMHPEDKEQLAINTHDETLWTIDYDGIETLHLFKADYESVCMIKWPAGLELDDLEFSKGVEYFVITGSFSDQSDTYTKGSWLRLPCGSKQEIKVLENCLVLRKSEHLLNPELYA